MATEASLWPEHTLRRALTAMVISGALSGLTAALLLTRHRLLAGLFALGSGVALLVGSTLARRDGGGPRHVGARARLVERVLDLVFDAAILVPLAWVMRAGSNWDAILAIVGLGAAYLATYQRARGQALGYAGTESLGYRVTREGLLVLGLLTGWVAGALWAFTVIAMAAVVTRLWNIVLQERQSGLPESAR